MITIIVLLILASITIITLTGNNGILNKADVATEENRKETATEIINLKITNAQIQSYTEKQKMATLQYLADRLYEDNEIQYIYNESQRVASKEKIEVTGEYIYTKLGEYPYEFKIDGKLRLASIDGIEVADNNINKEDFVSKEEYDTFKEEYNTLKEQYATLKGEQSKLIEKINSLTNEVGTLKNRSTTHMIDTKRRLKYLNENEIYTATEDCIFIGYINSKQGGSWTLIVDGTVVNWIGHNANTNIGLAFPSIFLKKGSTIQITRPADGKVENYHDKLFVIYGIK